MDSPRAGSGKRPTSLFLGKFHFANRIDLELHSQYQCCDRSDGRHYLIRQVVYCDKLYFHPAINLMNWLTWEPHLRDFCWHFKEFNAPRKPDSESILFSFIHSIPKIRPGARFIKLLTYYDNNKFDIYNNSNYDFGNLR